MAIDKHRVCFRDLYRAENLCYQFEQGQGLLPQLRQIICLVEAGRDTRTRYITVAEDFGLFEAYLYTQCAYSKTELESQGDDRSLEHHCGQGNRPMSFRGVKRRGNPLNRNKNRLTIATNRISPRAYYRAENLRYQFKQGQELLPQLRQIICLVKVGRDTHTRCITVAEDYCLFEAFLYTVCACSKTEHEPQGGEKSERRA